MPVFNTTRENFLDGIIIPFYPVAWPSPFTTQNLEDACEWIEGIVISGPVWQGIKAILFGMTPADITSPEVIASLIDTYCANQNLTAWQAVEEPQ